MLDRGTIIPFLLDEAGFRVFEFANLNRISSIVDENYVNKLDLTIMRVIPSKIFENPKSKQVETLFRVQNNQDILNDADMLDMFRKIILKEDEINFISLNNFAFSKDLKKLATKDMHIMIDNKLSKNIPEEEMLHLATVASMMLTNMIDYYFGYEYILKRIKRYGHVEFRYHSNGILNLIIVDHEAKSRNRFLTSSLLVKRKP